MHQDMETAFGRLIKENKDRIFRICLFYAKDEEDQKDLFQEISLNIWRSLPKFRYESKIETWIYRIALNVCLQYKLSAKRSHVDWVKIESVNVADNVENIQDKLENSELLWRLNYCISKLNEADRSITLLFLEDLSYREIAGISGLSENHVAVKITRIKKRLTDCFST